MGKAEVLLVYGGVNEPSLLARRALQSALRSEQGFFFDQSNSLECLPEKEPALRYQAVVAYLHHTQISPPALKALDSYLLAGGGFLAVHSAAADFQGAERYVDLLGGQVRDEGVVEPFQVIPTDSAEGIFGLIGPFELRDERYLHEVASDVQVHFFLMGPEGREPFIWTRRHGAGRVCYVAAGHTASGLRHPAVQQILRKGLCWCAGIQ